MTTTHPGVRWRRAVPGSTVALALAGAATPALAGGTTSTPPPPLVPVTDKGSLHNITAAIGAHAAYDQGFTGKGTDIALIDTGVTEVPGLTSGNLLHGPDLSFDSQVPELATVRTVTRGLGRGQIARVMAYGGPTNYRFTADELREILAAWSYLKN